MMVSLITSFGLFDLWNSFGVYHALSIVSFLTLAIALYFPIGGRNKKNEPNTIYYGWDIVI
jgi:hypothetical protein